MIKIAVVRDQYDGIATQIFVENLENYHEEDIIEVSEKEIEWMTTVIKDTNELEVRLDTLLYNRDKELKAKKGKDD